VIPLERGHRVIEPYDVNAEVVRETAGGMDDRAYEVHAGIAPEVPDGRGRGDRGGSGEEGEDGGELHFEWSCSLEFEYQSYISQDCERVVQRLTEVETLFAEVIICLRIFELGCCEDGGFELGGHSGWYLYIRMHNAH